jgi:hypothetical protein
MTGHPRGLDRDLEFRRFTYIVQSRGYYITNTVFTFC